MKTTSLLRVAFITLIAAFTANVHATVISWNGAAQTNVAIPWSTGANWGGGTAPSFADDVKFYDAGAVASTSNINNTVDADRTISSLFFSQTNNNHTTFITNGATLRVTNSAGSAFGTTIFMVGLTNDHTAVKTNYTTIAGPGTLYVSNTAAYIVTAQGQGTLNASRAVLDMSGLDTFNGNVRAWGVSSINHFFNNVAQRLGAYVYLAKTNTVKLNLTDTLANLSTSGARTNGLEIGYFSAANNGSVQNWFFLGQTNAFFVDSIGIGRSKSSSSSAATLAFNPAFTNLGPVAYFRGINGGNNRVIWWAVGDMADNGSSAQISVGTNDFTGGTIDAMVDSMSLSRDCSGSQTAGGSFNQGAFIFTAGTVDVNTLYLGNQILGPVGNTTGNIGHMNVNGSSAILKVNTLVAMANTTAASGNSAIRTLGQFTIRNSGTANINTLTVGALSTNTGFILMTNLGTLNITNVAGSLTRGITTFNTTNSTLGFVINPSTNNNFVATNINAGGGSNVIRILNAGIYASYPTQVTLIKAQGTFIGSNTYVLDPATLAASAPGASLVANPANNSLDLLLPTDPRPIITGQPAGFAGSAGVNVNLIVTNTGVAPFTYQWKRSGTNITDTGSWTGTTTTNLVINNGQVADSGDYSVVIANAYGSVTSSIATVTLSSGAPVAPVITGPTPSSQSVIATSNITFTTSVSGFPTPDLQWQKNGVDIAGSNTTSLTITGAQYPADQATYSLIASNIAGVVTNSVALTVYVYPEITTQPTNLTVTVGSSATFTVNATGVPTPTYQWRKNGTAIPGATANTFTIASTVATNMGAYTVVVSNNAAAIISTTANLIVNSTMTTTALSPTNGAAGICFDTPLYVTFSTAPTLRKAGSIKIFNSTNTVTPVDIIDLSASVDNNTTYAANVQPRTIGGTSFTNFPVIVTGNQAAIYPHLNLLTSNQTYYVTVDNGTFTDSSSNFFVGITDTNAWRFTTVASLPASAATNPVVAADGTGDFATVQGAIDYLPTLGTNRRTITIRDGTYTEIISVNKSNVTFRGSSRSGTVLRYANNSNVYGNTHNRMSFLVNANFISIENLTLSNSTPKGGSQAEALMVESTKKQFIAHNVTIASYQDTILMNGSDSTHYFSDSLIQGDTDFIWGGGNAFFTNCEIKSLNGGSVTQPRTATGSNGFAFLYCTFTRSNGVSGNDLGRSIGITNSMCVIINSKFDAHLGGWGSDMLPTNNFRNYYLGNSNLTASAAVNLTNGQLLTTSDAVYVSGTNATTWLNGWTPGLAPNIITQPVSQTNDVGGNTTFTIAATGIPAPTYQWQFNGMDISSATSTSFTLPNLTNGNGGNYTVIVANASGSVTSSVAALTVICTTAGITTSPANQTVSQGTTATFSVTATGSSRTYQWQLSTDNGATFNNVTDATNASYTTPATTLGDNGNQYQVVVSVGCDSSTATSTAATNTVICYPAALTSNPSDKYVSSGTSATFTVGATGSLLTYQWQLSTDNGGSYNNVTDATNASYTTPATTGSDNGNKYLCTVTAACGSLTNTTAAKLNVIAGTTTSFRSAANGNWNANGTWELSADNGATWVAATVTPTDANCTNIAIRSPHTVTVTANVSADQMTIASGATNVVNSGVTFTIADGSGTDLSVGGVLKNAGTVATVGTVEVTSTGKYQHNYASSASAVLGVIPTATWNTGSTCEVIGFTNPPTKVIWGTNATHGLSQAFYHFTWNCPNQTTSICLGSVLTNVSGDFTYIGSPTNAGVTSLGSTVAGVNYQLAVGGNFSVGGTGKLLTGSSANSTNLINLGGDFTINTGATFDSFGSATNILRFTKSGTQVFTRAGTQLTGASLGYAVDVSSTLILSNTISVTNLDFTVDGKVIARAALSAVSPAKVRVNSTGKYQHDLNGAAIPTGVWSPTSTCEILGVTTTVPTASSLGQVFGNFTWNCAAQSAPVSFASTSFTNTGNFRLQNCNASEVSLATSTAATARIEGNLSVENGTLVLANGTGIPTVTVLGNATISSGATLKLAASTGNPVFTVGGGLTNSGTYSAAVVAATTATKASVTGNVEFGGTLVFATNTTPTAGTTFDLFDAASFSGSFASTTLASPLPSGQNWYVGNLSTDGTILLNRAPTPANPTVSRASGLTAKILASIITATDADGHSVTLESVSGVSTNGATISLVGSYYTIPASTVNDAFTYTVNDAFGGTNTGTVSINIGAGTGQGTGSINTTGSNANLTFYGQPGTNYSIQVSVDAMSTWTDLVTNAAPSTGVITYTDTFTTNAATFYRLRYVP